MEKNKQELKNIDSKKDDDIIKDKSVENLSDHVDKTQTHENLGHRDPAQQNLNKNNSIDNKVYRSFASKTELSEYIDKKVKKFSSENEKLKKEIEILKNSKEVVFKNEKKSDKPTPKIKLFGVI